jgi:phage baseplate assembly protein W
MKRLTIELLGRGWGLPLAPGPDGALARADGAEKVRQSIYLILETEPGERVMRPTFGCGLRRFLMKPNTTATRALIQREVAAALNAWEPRIEVQAVEASPADDPAAVLITISYVHRVDGQPANLVYPFYLE